MKKRLGLTADPLDDTRGLVCLPRFLKITSTLMQCAQTSKPQYMFQYFLKVVSTQFRTYDGQTVSSADVQFMQPNHILPNAQVNTHQYSATEFERDLTEGNQGDTPQGIHVQHGVTGVPGNIYVVISIIKPD